MLLADKDCIYSAVKNTSGHSQIHSWLPGHGGTLAAGETRYIFGNVVDYVARSGQRVKKSFARLLDLEDLQIVALPAPLLKDTSTGLTKMVKLTGGTLSAVDPSYYDSDSLADDVNHVITPRGRDDRKGVPA